MDGSEIFTKIDEQPLMLSSIIAIGQGRINKEDDEEPEALYKSCFNKMEDLNCTKNVDELLNENMLMNKENKIINDFNDEYNSCKNNKLLADKLLEELKCGESINLLPIYPNIKKNERKILIISNYVDDVEEDGNKKVGKIEENEKDLLNDIISEYFDIKRLLND